MIADARTLETLDFGAIRDRLVAGTQTERGRSRAGALAPLADFDQVRRAQRATAAARELLASADLHVLPAVDTAELTQRARVGTVLSALELRQVGEAVAAAQAARNKIEDAAEEALRELAAAHRPLRELSRAIEDAIDERGTILERASPALARIRREQQRAQSEARERVSALLRSAKYAKAIQDHVVTIREGRFVVPIKAEFAGEVPGIVHDASSSGQTLFVEPLAALESNNRVRTLRMDEEREIARILHQLSARVGEHAEQVERNVDVLADIDLVTAKAGLAQRMNAQAPELCEQAEIAIVRGRHPLLGERAVPQSLDLIGERRTIVVSGPNMGGKTVALKMVGLFALMAFCGLHLPADPGTRVGRLSGVFTDIGDEQSIEENASTFSAHIARMRSIIETAGDRSLVLVDEIGGGTEPASGAALGIAMLERLLEIRALTIVTTHSTELKLFAHQAAGAVNASVRFDPQSFAPTYHLDVGVPGQSLAFALAQTLGLPSAMLDRARSLLANRERDYEAALEQLAALSVGLQRDREEAQRERAHAQRLQDQIRSRTEALERERRTFAERAEQALQQTLRDFTAELAQRAAGQQHAAKARVTSGQSALLSQTIDAIRRDLGIASVTSLGSGARALTAGEVVWVRSLAQEAQVIAQRGDAILVSIGPMRTSVSRDDVEPRGAGKPKATAQAAAAARLEARAASTSELDVRGKRYVEAEPLVERWIDEALLAGNSPLRLIHGKGTGMLGRGLQEYLRAHDHVQGVRYGTETEGGSGVTIFDLE